VWAGESALWKSGEDHKKTIENALGWLTVPERLAATVEDLRSFVSEAIPETSRVVVLGMGGSSLAPLVFASSFKKQPGYPELEVLDSTEPSMVLATAGRSDPARTLFIVSSKSGTTLEPNILFDYFFDLAEKALGGKAGGRFVVVTDPGSALEKEGERRRVRRVFPGDPQIGGRYSALSNFGLVPAAFLGVDLAELLRRARDMADRCRRDAPANPGAVLGAAMAALAMQGRDKVTFSVGRPVDRFGMWAEQLIAESTGKEGKGILPVEGEALGPPEAYGVDRFFVRIETARGAGGAKEALDPLAQAGHPIVSLELADAHDLGAEMFRWEFATAIAGALLAINPFDQPNVQEAKDRTNEILENLAQAGQPPHPAGRSLRELRPAVAAGTDVLRGETPRTPPLPGGEGEDLRKHLDSLKAGDYFAITAYIPSTEENEAKLSRLRLLVRDAKKVATTVGFGPRFLHSTGQLHKGGPDSGVFLQITAEPAQAVPIPGKPFGFSDVVAAQAAGDLAALSSRGRRAMRVNLSKDASSGLDALTAAVSRALEKEN
jgi:glucose-6-phosphate isomerase